MQSVASCHNWLSPAGSITTLAFARDSAFLSIAEMVVLPMVLCLTILLAVFTVLILVSVISLPAVNCGDN